MTNWSEHLDDKEKFSDYARLYLQEWPVDSERGTGRTSELIMKLPLGGTLMVLNADCVRHTRALLGHLGRMDVRMVTYSAFNDRDLSYPYEGFDVDHAVWEELHRRGTDNTIGRLSHAVNVIRDGIEARKRSN